MNGLSETLPQITWHYIPYMAQHTVQLFSITLISFSCLALAFEQIFTYCFDYNFECSQ